jgi:hypothetical protein
MLLHPTICQHPRDPGQVRVLLHYGSYLICLPPYGKVPDRERVTIRSRKVMRTLVCGPAGFAFDSGCKFSAGCYVSKVLNQGMNGGVSVEVAIFEN